MYYWHNFIFCDWYIEIVKSRLYNKENTDEKTVESRITAQKVLNKVLGDILKLLHPIMHSSCIICYIYCKYQWYKKRVYI